MTFLRYISLMLIVCVVASCGNDTTTSDNNQGDILVKIGNLSLTTSDLASNMPYGLSPEDSIKFTRAYIRSWIDNKLISEIAVRNIADTKNIDKMVDEYRNELIMWEYRKQMLQQNSNFTLPEDTLKSYYQNHSEQLKLKSPIIKGIYIKIQADAPDIDKIRKWYKSDKSSDIDQLEKYGLNEAIHYDYFKDKWIDWEQIESRIPHNFSNTPNQILAEKRDLDITSNGFTYLLHISEYLPEGAIMPYEVAQETIKEMFINEHRLEYDRNLRQQLYEKAFNSGEITLRVDIGQSDYNSKRKQP